MGAKPERTNPPVRSQARAGLTFLILIAAVILGTHYPLWDMPYFWDELGQFVPAALDIYQRGAWVPVTTLPNIHPPAVPALLAGVWTIFGYSIPAARLTMLLIASAGAFLAFLLTLRLAHGVPGLPGFVVLILLLVNPLFYTQSMMAQLDLPAMTLTLLALYLFLEGRITASVLACLALVWVKETGAALPLVLAAFSWRDGRRKDALLFLLPCASLFLWLGILWAKTGNLLGNREFAEYNVFYPLHPARLGMALARRAYELLVHHGYFLGLAAVAAMWKRVPAFHTRAAKLISTYVVVQVLVVTIAGGAVLERYLLPVLPLVLMAYAYACCSLRGWKAIALPAVVAVLSLTGFFLPSLVPQPFENTLRMTRVVGLFETAAHFTEQRFPQAEVTAQWPLSDALRRPEFGYVENGLRVRKLDSLSTDAVARLREKRPEVLIWYSSDVLANAWFFRILPPLADLRRDLYGWQPDAEGFYIEEQLGLREVARWNLGDASIAVFARPELLRPLQTGHLKQ